MFRLIVGAPFRKTPGPECLQDVSHHLAVVLGEEKAQLIGSCTPLKIYRDITARGNGLTDEVIDNLSREEMIDQNILSLSMFEQLDESYQFLKPFFLSFSREKKLKKFLLRTSAEVRYKKYVKLINNSSAFEPVHKKQIAMKV